MSGFVSAGIALRSILIPATTTSTRLLDPFIAGVMRLPRMANPVIADGVITTLRHRTNHLNELPSQLGNSISKFDMPTESSERRATLSNRH